MLSQLESELHLPDIGHDFFLLLLLSNIQIDNKTYCKFQNCCS